MTESDTNVEFEDDFSDSDAGLVDASSVGEAVMFSADWTTETVLSQLRRKNIGINPRFQRRDAWPVAKKSKLIESLILGLPVPPIVLAEDRHQRGRYVVLDGKQRLLALLQFWGLGEGSKNAYRLSALDIRPDLAGKSIVDLEQDPALAPTLTALLNQTIRTVVIRNWPSDEFLNLVFLRLNTGSTPLSPQELRHAISPGPFTDHIDDFASNSQSLRRLLRISEPDFRMRDIELAARHVAYLNFLEKYPGRMKPFLDTTYIVLNRDWQTWQPRVTAQLPELERAIDSLIEILGDGLVARKPNSHSLNRAVFDPLAYYFQDSAVRSRCVPRAPRFKEAYNSLFEPGSGFLASIERDTAGLLSTSTRFGDIGRAIERVTNTTLPIPRLVEGKLVVDRAGH